MLGQGRLTSHDNRDFSQIPDHILSVVQAHGFQYVYVHPYLGKIPILTHIFQIG